MKYRLVLQWPASSIEDYDAMIEIEDLLIASLLNSNVDGHDAGSDEVNIFIETDDPLQAFDQVRSALDSHCMWSDIRAAYRNVEGSTYTVLWPKGLHNFRVR
jgi:hypothetical protein